MLRKIVLAVAVAMLPGAAAACEVLEPFEMAGIAGAELVIVGEVTGYQDLGTAWEAALVTVQVDEVLKGRAKGEVTFIWTGGMAQGPHQSRARGQVLIGAMQGGRIAVTTMVPDLRPDLPSIIQPYCGDVWMQAASPAVVEAARKALQ
jgi:hypothetical protein